MGKGIKSKDLLSVLDFIYNGEVSIYQEDIESFMGIAEELELKGLIDTKQSNESNIQERQEFIYDSSVTVKMDRKTTDRIVSIEMYDEGVSKDFLLDGQNDTSNDVGLIPVEDMQFNVTNNELNDTIETMLEKVEGVWNCKMCGKSSGHKVTLKRHIESQHTTGSSHP